MRLNEVVAGAIGWCWVRRCHSRDAVRDGYGSRRGVGFAGVAFSLPWFHRPIAGAIVGGAAGAGASVWPWCDLVELFFSIPAEYPETPMGRSKQSKVPSPSLVLERVPHRSDGRQRRSKRRPHSRCSCLGRIVVLGAAPIVLFVSYAFVRLHLVLGISGSPLPDVLSSLPPMLKPAEVHAVLKLATPPGNLAVTNEGRVIFNFHPEYEEPSGAKIAECRVDSTPGSGCGAAWTRHPSTDRVKTVLSLRVDRQDRLWLLDFAEHSTISSPALLAYQLGQDGASDTFLYRYRFRADVAPFGCMLNDFQVSPDGEYIYIADTAVVGTIAGFGAQPALLVYHVPTNQTRRVLSGHHSMRVQPGVSMAVHGSAGVVWPQKLGPFSMAIAVDSIVLDRVGKWLYFGPVTGSTLFRLPVSALQDVSLNASALETQVTRRGELHHHSSSQPNPTHPAPHPRPTPLPHQIS